MNKILAALALLAIAAPAQATLYGDSTGDILATNAIMDIVSVEVTDDGTDINFKFTLGGDVVVTNWGKYLVMIDTVPGGDNVGNGWVRPISWGQGGGSPGADYWIGSWLDSGNGAELYNFPAGWALQDATYTNGLIGISKSGSTATITTALSRLGLGLDQTFCFDAFTSGGGGGDGAVDSLGNPAQQIANWGDHSDAHPVCYTTSPEPGSLALLAIGALAMLRRRR